MKSYFDRPSATSDGYAKQATWNTEKDKEKYHEVQDIY